MVALSPESDERPSKPQSWIERLQALPWWGKIVLLWMALAIGLTLAGLASTRLLDMREGYDPIIGVPPDQWPGVWARWDSPYYVNIAMNGYAAVPYAMGYFPLYPLSLSLLSNLTGWNLATAGVIIAQASYLVALLLFYRLARLIRDEHGFAMRSVIAMAVFPTSFFFMAMYAESMALAFGIASVYFALKGRWIPSGLALGLAAAARPVGWLLLTIILVEFVRRRRFDGRSIVSLLAGLALAISGVVAYVLYLYTITGTFFAVPQATSLWLRTWQLPWVTILKSIRLVFTGSGVAGDWFLYAVNWSDLLFSLFATAMTVLSFRRLPRSLSIYLVASLVFLFCQQGLEMVPLWGMARWAAALFPIYLVMADVLHGRRSFRLATATSAVLLFAFSAWWATGRWVG